MQLSFLEGVFGDSFGNFLPSFPVNMFPELGENGLSNGYLKTAPGITTLTTGPGADRGAILWQISYYRVMGSKLVHVVSGVASVLGDVGNNGKPVSLDYGTDRVAIASNGNLYYFDGLTLTQVTDPNLGTALDVCYIDGYYMTTDGSYLVVTNLSDPTTVNPLKYGSSEADPDQIVAVKRVRDEIYAVNLTTIENFQNVGGSGFPFQRNPGGLIPKGACGTHAVTYFLDSLAFVGSGRGEKLSAYIAGNGQATCIGTPAVDRELSALTLAQVAALEVEAIVANGEQRLLVHLPTKTLVYHHQATLAAGRPIWTTLAGGANMDQAYPGRHFVHDLAGVFNCGDSAGHIGVWDESVETLFGAATTQRFDTKFMFNGGLGAILKSAELFGASGLAPVGVTNTGYFSWTADGKTWSQERAISLGSSGQSGKRMQWRPMTRLRGMMGLRFRFPAASNASFMRLEVQAEPLNV